MEELRCHKCGKVIDEIYEDLYEVVDDELNEVVGYCDDCTIEYILNDAPSEVLFFAMENIGYDEDEIDDMDDFEEIEEIVYENREEILENMDIYYPE